VRGIFVQIDFAAREITIKLVYYGPALSGKTTNLQSLHHLTSKQNRGRLMTLETRDDRTLFFDLLPLSFRGSGSDLAIRTKLFTVPGQVIHGSTRRLVLQGVDGIVFVADSQVNESKNNAAAFLDLKENLTSYGLELSTIPMVIQFNKRDLLNVRTEEEIASQARRGKEPVFCAVATQGDGVLETFMGLMYIALQSLDRTNQLSKKFGIDVRSFLGETLQFFGEHRNLEQLLATAKGPSILREDV
jgi:mutual gliding-motility protein MglA